MRGAPRDEARAERDRYQAALEELVDIVRGHIEDGDKLDSFTLQPAEQALTQTAEPSQSSAVQNYLRAGGNPDLLEPAEGEGE